MNRLGSGSGDAAEREAAAWAVRSAERALTREEQAELDAWLAKSSRNLGAYVRAQAIWLDVDRVAALDSGSRAEASSTREEFEEEEPRRHWRRYAIAASIAVAMISGGSLAWDRFAGRVSTSRDEIREIVLDDGSTATLNGGAVLQVRYDGDERRVILRRGEALFEVAHDTARPFIVSADDVEVRAVGTKFAVDVENDEVEVTVAEGTVAVTEQDAPSPRLVSRNQEFVRAPTGARRTMLDESEVGRRLAWERGLLVFSGQSLGRAASEVNRYSSISVTIDDPTLARAEFVGVFRVGDGRAFAHAAAQAFNGQVVERDDGLHLMRAANSPSH